MPAPERTSLVAIVDAGRALLEEGGQAGVTMQAVAERVGVRAPSLYKRVRDRDALLAAVADDVVDDLAAAIAEGGDDLAAIGRAFRAFGRAHPQGFRLVFTGMPSADALQRSVVPLLDTMARLVGTERALDAARLLTAWATGFVQMELAGAFRLGGDVDEAFDYGLAHVITAVTG